MKTLADFRKQHPSLRMDGVEIFETKYDPTSSSADESGYVESVVDVVVVKGMSMTAVQQTIDHPDMKVLEMVKLCAVHPSPDKIDEYVAERPGLAGDLFEMVTNLSTKGWQPKKKIVVTP